MTSPKMPRKLWEHPHKEDTEMYEFLLKVNSEEKLSIKTFEELHNFSITRRSAFWAHLFEFLSFIYEGGYSHVVDEHARMDSIPRWFEGVRLNFAENLLFRRSQRQSAAHVGYLGKEDAKIAVVEVREGGSQTRHISWAQLRLDTMHLANAMRQHGVTKGDRIAIVASNSYDSLKVFLACTALGGIFSSSSTDMGAKGILDRLNQIKPKYLFMDDFAVYNGKTIDLRAKMQDILTGLEDRQALQSLVVMPRFGQRADLHRVPGAQHLDSFTAGCSNTDFQDSTFYFERVDFNDPLMIVYSSGTTGQPKCIVHSVGGALICAAKESILHSEVSSKSSVLQYTTTGWIMYFLAIVNLFSGAQIVLYDGSPFFPDPVTFIKLLEKHKVTKLGTSPKWMSEIQKQGIVPREVCDLSSLQTVSSTGMFLSNELFEWFYDTAFPQTTHLANISGGTDLAGCFGIENPLTPVYMGGTQGPSLGVPVAVYDSLIEGGIGLRGVPVADGTPGELVAYGAFPNMPVFFWNDAPSPSPKSKYFNAYFAKYDNVWTHGDSVMFDATTGQLMFLGRADGVLNPLGIRFGSAEIYSVVEKNFSDRVSDSLCVGQKRPSDEDERVMLFLKMKSDTNFSQKLVAEVKSAIRQALSPRHVPRFVFETPEIPTTINMKKVELPVKHIVSGKRVQPSGTIANPQSLDFYYQFQAVEDIVPARSKL